MIKCSWTEFIYFVSLCLDLLYLIGFLHWFNHKFAGTEHPCTVLYKMEHWNVPDYLPWGVPLTYLYFSRFSELLVHKPGEGFLLSLLATLLFPVVKFLPCFEFFFLVEVLKVWGHYQTNQKDIKPFNLIWF